MSFTLVVRDEVILTINANCCPTAFPAAILQGVFFDPKLPDYLNLGSFGAVVGHEITHGLSMTYRDERGRLHNKWRTQGADKNYTERATCLKNQYGSIVDKQTGLKLNGTLTLEDDIADNGGIHVAFATWKRLETGKRANQQLLPGMKEWTRDQLFFIAYAQVRSTQSRMRQSNQSV